MSAEYNAEEKKNISSENVSSEDEINDIDKVSNYRKHKTEKVLTKPQEHKKALNQEIEELMKTREGVLISITTLKKEILVNTRERENCFIHKNILLEDLYFYNFYIFQNKNNQKPSISTENKKEDLKKNILHNKIFKTYYSLYKSSTKEKKMIMDNLSTPDLTPEIEKQKRARLAHLDENIQMVKFYFLKHGIYKQLIDSAPKTNYFINVRHFILNKIKKISQNLKNIKDTRLEQHKSLNQLLKQADSLKAQIEEKDDDINTFMWDCLEDIVVRLTSRSKKRTEKSTYTNRKYTAEEEPFSDILEKLNKGEEIEY